MEISNFNISFEKLHYWIDQNGWKGYDPYDIKGKSYIIRLTALGNKSKLASLFREFVFEIFTTFPVISRKVMNIKPQINAKAMGLFAKAYLDIYQVTQKNIYLLKAEECIQWLYENKTEINGGYGWGYPFDWQSALFIPANTPNGIVTTAVGDAFWSFWKFTGDKKYLNSCKKISIFLNSLPYDKVNGNICFSYTPLYINHVHNLNLFVAEFLIKTGVELDIPLWIEKGNAAASYSISSQLPDGSFDYNGPPEPPGNFIDNYHTGFVLRNLHSIWKLTKREDVFLSLKKCYDHYKNNFFEDQKIPKLKPDRKYRIDIHSCAESINCLSELSDTFPEASTLAGNILQWTIENLQDNKGLFLLWFT